MDKLYMILLCLMVVPILICIKYSRKIKSDVASSIAVSYTHLTLPTT